MGFYIKITRITNRRISKFFISSLIYIIEQNKIKMKKFYYIYEINEDWTEKFKFRATSEHAAIQWIEDHLKKSKYRDSKFKIQPIYKDGILYSKEEVNQ